MKHNKIIEAKINVLTKQVAIIVANESKVCLKCNKLVNSNDFALIIPQGDCVREILFHPTYFFIGGGGGRGGIYQAVV